MLQVRIRTDFIGCEGMKNGNADVCYVCKSMNEVGPANNLHELLSALRIVMREVLLHLQKIVLRDAISRHSARGLRS